MAHYVTAAAVTNSFSVPNTSRNNDYVVVVVMSEVANSSESVLGCIHSNYIIQSCIHSYIAYIKYR